MKAALITIAVLWLLDWVSSGAFDLWTALGTAVWVSAVLGALTLVGSKLDTQSTPVWKQLLALAITAGVASSVIHIILYSIISALPELAAEREQPGLATAAIVGFFDGDALFGFWALLVELPRRIGAERRLEQERRALHQEAELARIRAALEPHFVLNTLNTIAGLVTEDPAEARNLIAALGDLLRGIVQDARRSHHTVREELSWLQGFARIVETRHFGRLDFAWSVEGAVEECILPVLLLQPLLENAVHHGALRRPAGGRVALRVAGDERYLRCVVEDAGPGFDATATRAEGRGLELVRRRVALESSEAALRIDSKPGATRVEIVLPRRTA